MAEPPKTLEAWAHYIAGLAGPDLSSKARAVNDIDFVESLIDEGYDPDEVETIFVLLAQHLARAGRLPPESGLYSYRRMATQRPPVDIALPPAHAGEPVEDEVDQLLAE